MSRPVRCRRICQEPSYDYFAPDGIWARPAITLSLDEFETIRLIDNEGKTQEEAARLMDVARTTVTAIYERARRKIADSLVHGRPLYIAGGDYRLCDGSAKRLCQNKCCRRQKASAQKNVVILLKGDQTMRIAVTYEDGEIFQHFGHTENFKIYDIKDGKVIQACVVSTHGQGHGALADFLTQNGVETLICGGIGGGAQVALANKSIQLYGGVSGNADEAVNAFLAGKLEYQPDVRCRHHDHEGGGGACGDHGCGEHGCH